MTTSRRRMRTSRAGMMLADQEEVGEAVEEERAGAKAADVKNAESRCVINTESRTNDIATMCSASAARKTAIGVAQSCGGDIKAVYGICREPMPRFPDLPTFED